VCYRLSRCGRLDSPFRLLLVLSELFEVCAFPAVMKVITKFIDKASTECLQCLEYSAHLFCIMAYILSEYEDNNEYVPYTFYCICPSDAQYMLTFICFF
jgi:hypothetical protein